MCHLQRQQPGSLHGQAFSARALRKGPALSALDKGSLGAFFKAAAALFSGSVVGKQRSRAVKAALPVLCCLCLPVVFCKLQNCQTLFACVNFFLCKAESKQRFSRVHRLERSWSQ